ncbi:MAG: hypothetical protein E7169_02065 [Firmicutes bacterium]|nr:hypothetical protein [Bacillota bacterium]
MILITLGTQDKSFERLLKAIDIKIEQGKVKDKVVVQAGLTKYKSENMEIYDFVEYDKFDELIKSCDILITHGGVGSIITGLKNNKKVIAAARLKKYKEHTNDHQLQIIDNFKKAGYILELADFDKIDEKIEEVKKFKPKKYKSNKDNFNAIIEKEINKYL